MAKVIGAVVVDTETCKGCEVCIGSCPTNVLRMSPVVNSKGYKYAYMENPDNCTGCSNCSIVCPDAAITVYRTKLEEVK